VSDNHLVLLAQHADKLRRGAPPDAQFVLGFWILVLGAMWRRRGPLAKQIGSLFNGLENEHVAGVLKDLQQQQTEQPALDELPRGACFGDSHFAFLQLLGELEFGLDIEEHLRLIRGADRIAVALDSPGGDALKALRLYDALAAKPHVEVTVHRLAASGAAIVLQGGTHRRIAEQGHVMVHPPNSSIIGTATELRHRARDLAATRERIHEVFSRRCDRKDVRRWLRRGQWWFNARDALAAGLVDEIIDLEPPVMPEQAKADGVNAPDTALAAVGRIFLTRLAASMGPREFQHLIAQFAAKGLADSPPPTCGGKL
jgi:ATP-dependent protease ClpP protease subunit